MESVNHLGFILAAYAATVLVIGVLIAWVALDYRVQRRVLADLDAKGVGRRSAATRSAPAAKSAGEGA